MEIKKINLKNKFSFREIKIFKNIPFKDKRGNFSRLFCQKNFKKNKINFTPVQINLSENKKIGTIRGLHYQDKHLNEKKLVTCISGKVIDVIVDIREKSKNYLKHFTVNLSKQNHLILLIPPGFAHGFQTLEENTKVLYLHSSFFNAEGYRTLNPLDKKLNINWPITKKILSKKDRYKSKLI